jgi:hypothetical protein
VKAVLVVAGREDEGHAARGERVRDGVAPLPVEVDVEHRRVDGLGLDHREGLIDAGGGADDLAAQAGEHVLQRPRHHHLVLDHEDAAAGKPAIHGSSTRAPATRA